MQRLFRPLPPPRRGLRFIPRATALLLVAAGTLLGTTGAHAQVTGTLTTLRSFNGPSGEDPDHALTLGSDGNFYGTTPRGGSNGDGEVFRVSPAGAVTVLHSFSSLVDGQSPECKLVLANDRSSPRTAISTA